MLIIGPSGSGKTSTLLHLIDKFHPIDKIYLYAKDTNEDKYQYLINKREHTGIKNLNDPHAFIEYSNDMNDVLEDINNYNKKRDKKVLIIFDDMIADIMRSEKFKAIVKELFIRCRKLNISIVFITQSYFRTPKDARLNSTHYILMKIGNKKELKNIAEENSGHLDFKDFLKIYNYCTKDPYSFMMVDTRVDLNYKPNALDKARFEFSPLGQTFNTGLDKNAQGYQEEGIIKLLKDIRDGLAGGITPRAPKVPGAP